MTAVSQRRRLQDWSSTVNLLWWCIHNEAEHRGSPVEGPYTPAWLRAAGNDGTRHQRLTVTRSPASIRAYCQQQQQQHPQLINISIISISNRGTALILITIITAVTALTQIVNNQTSALTSEDGKSRRNWIRGTIFHQIFLSLILCNVLYSFLLHILFHIYSYSYT